jgi:hypothetical protein
MTQVVNAIQLSANPEAQTESFRSVILGRDAWVSELVESERALRKAAECQRDQEVQRRVAVEQELRAAHAREPRAAQALRQLATHVNEMASQMDQLTVASTQAPAM